jgi:hypothetical protein
MQGESRLAASHRGLDTWQAADSRRHPLLSRIVAPINSETEDEMHTDEYEISIAREVNHCERVVKKTREKLAERQQRFGLDYPEAASAAAEGRLSIKQKELADWQEDFAALPVWAQRLEEYREALAAMRISASRL